MQRARLFALWTLTGLALAILLALSSEGAWSDARASRPAPTPSPQTTHSKSSAPLDPRVSTVAHAPSASPTLKRSPAGLILPDDGALAPMPPALTRLRTVGSSLKPKADSTAEVTGALLAEVGACERCHQAATAHWRSSAHAHSSFSNQVYRHNVTELRKAQGRRASRHCGGCHDPALLVDGAMDAPINPEDERAQTGVSCLVCHGAAAARADGNGSYTLNSLVSIVPRGAKRSLSGAARERHKQAMMPETLTSGALCLSCHRGFLPERSGFIEGVTEALEWQRSAYAGNHAERVDERVPRRSCQQCHMRPVKVALPDLARSGGRIASHRFPGGNTLLAQANNDTQQLAAIRELLVGAVSVAVPVISSGEQRATCGEQLRVAPEAPLTFDVVVRNLRVGHHFPGGISDLQHTWLEVSLLNARGRVIAQSGATTLNSSLAAERPHRLRTLLADSHGKLLNQHQTHLAASVVANHTIGPRDAALIRYTYKGSATKQLAAIRVRVLHQSRRSEMVSAAGTVPAPSTEVASTTVLLRAEPMPATGNVAASVLVAEARRISARACAERLADYGLAGLKHLPEDLAGVSQVLRTALGRLGRARGGEHLHARLLWALAEAAGRQGRRREVEQWLRQAERFSPGHPALAATRARAAARGWNWQRAYSAWQQASFGAGRDDRVWAGLANAAANLNQSSAALTASQRGLELNPHHEALLRTQALTLGTLNDPSEERALAAYLSRRPPDDTSAIKHACAMANEACAFEQLPVHTHWLRELPAAEPQPRPTNRPHPGVIQ